MRQKKQQNVEVQKKTCFQDNDDEIENKNVYELSWT